MRIDRNVWNRSTTILLPGILSLFVASACGPTAEPADEPVVIVTDENAEMDDNSTETPDEETPTEEEMTNNAEEPEPGPEPEPEPELEERTATTGAWSEGFTCEVACQDRGWSCDARPDRTGQVTYTKTTENDRGDRFTTRQTLVVEACAQEIPELYDEYDYAPDHEFETARCPCLAEPVTKIQVDVDNLITCAAACAEQALECHSETPWTLGQESGGEAVYVTSDGTRYHPVGCEEIPSDEISRGGRTYTLSELHCGCQ